MSGLEDMYVHELGIAAGTAEVTPPSVWREATIVAVLSSPLGFAGMVLAFEEIPFPKELTGIPSYVGHPSTRALLEVLGAVTDISGTNGVPGKFAGPQIGEAFIAVPLASNPREGGWTSDTAVSDVSQLKAIRVIRIA